MTAATMAASSVAPCGSGAVVAHVCRSEQYSSVKVPAVTWVVDNFDPQSTEGLNWMGVLLLVGGFVAVVAGSVLMTVAQRRIPIQQAKHTRGRRTYGGQRSYLPLRVNHGGVMPIIFASSLMIFPSVIFSGL